MTQLKNTIFYLIGICILFLAISYFISVNKELAFYSVDSVWVSNDFLLSCFTGIFASFMVLIATEIYKFFQIKKSVEQWLFIHLTTLYGQLHIAENNIQKLLSSDRIPPTNLLHSLSNTIKQLTPGMRSVDYNPLFKTNKAKVIIRIIQGLHSNQLNKWELLAIDCVYLEVAIGTDMIDEHNKGIFTPVITSTSPNTNKTLKVLQNEIQHLKSQTSINITELNAVCGNRFHWREMENQIASMPAIDTSLEEFWKKCN